MMKNQKSKLIYTVLSCVFWSSGATLVAMNMVPPIISKLDSISIQEQAIKDEEVVQNDFNWSFLGKVIQSSPLNFHDDSFNQAFYDHSRDESEKADLYKKLSQFTDLAHRDMRYTPQGWPASGNMTSRFGLRVSPFNGKLSFHYGIDIANEGGTPVWATADGTVQYAEWRGRYGQLVIINHGFGYRTYYGHNSYLTVQKGETVKRGQIIAYMGSSGKTTGNHIHYEVRYNGYSINPRRYLASYPLHNLAATKNKSTGSNL